MQHEAWLGEQRLVRAGRAGAWVRLVIEQRFVIVFTTILAALLRLPTLGAKSLWYDELISISIARHPVSAILRARLRIDAGEDLIDQLFTNNPPLHLLIIHAVRKISTTDAAMRLPFALAGVAAIPVAYLVLRRLLGAHAAAIGALFFAVSPLHIAYSQEARPAALLVLFSLCGLLFLLRAFDDGSRREWVWVAVFGLLDVWSSYFAAIVVLPTLAVVALILVLSDRRRPTAAIGSTLRTPAIAFATILIGWLPLASDFFAVAHMNDATVSPTPSLGRVLINGWWMTVQLANPLPTWRLSDMLTTGLVVTGVLAVVRARSREVAVALAWILVPCAILLSIQTSHVMNTRYVLASLPMVLGLATFGANGLLPPPLRRARPRLARIAGAAILAVFFVFNAVGIRAYEARFIFTGPLKPNWRDAALAYTQAARAESCFVVIDGLGNAFSAVVPYYLEDAGAARCSIDARDPRLAAVAERHPDLWWGISTEWYYPEQSQALVAALQQVGEVEVFDLVVLLHPSAGVTGGGTTGIEAVLRRAMDAAEPEDCRSQILAPSVRESLANLYTLQGLDPDQIVPLVAGFVPPLSDSDALMWDRAEQRLDRGDVDGARTIAVRLVALYPGDPRSYDLLARVEQAAGHATWQSFDRLAAALPPAKPAPAGVRAAFGSCDATT
ncbi:MAG TPA: glycosyltransferase family 39 protein [Thermomicrobiales bacterium]